LRKQTAPAMMDAMLRHTFCHIQGVGPKTERRIWDRGIHTWDHACDPDALPLPAARSLTVARSAEESIRRLARRDAAWFYDKLPSSEQWRLFPAFRGSAAYLDIETTGLGGPYDYVTTIALYDGATVRHYVHDENLDDFRRDVEHYALIVTYNGKQFDVPFIRDHLGAPMRMAHIDLCFVLRSLGYKGGLKGCERQLGVARDGLDGVDGFFAVLLWREWLQSRDRRALDTLLAYNIADTVNLETLMVMAYNMKVRQAALPGLAGLPLPAAPEIPFHPHAETIARVRRTFGFGLDNWAARV
jgi:uncharacterized protein YprB with RNaseH-like and TPR domain